MVLTFVIAAGLGVLAALAALSLVRGLRRAMRIAAAEYVPIPEVNPPAAIVPTGWVEVVGWVTIIWSLTHLMLITLAVLARVVIFSVPITAAVMSYVLIASVIAGAGGIMLLRLIPYGRRMISWGLVLLGIVAILGFSLSLILRTYQDAPLISRELAPPLAVVLALHALTDTAVGAAAQRVGRGGQSEERREESQDSWPVRD
jgi:hypothetical protein